MDRRLLMMMTAGSRSARPAPENRAPLPPLPTGITVYSTLPWTPPHERDYLRADCWGITLEGLPFVPGGSSNYPAQNRFLSWFFDRYPLDWQERWIDQNFRNGYTHVFLSPPDEMGPVDPNTPGPGMRPRPPGSGHSLQQVVDNHGRLHATGLYVCSFLASKYFQAKDMTVQQYQDYAFPILDALTNAGVVDEIIPAWEMDLFNTPGDITKGICKSVGQRAHAAVCSCWLHFSPHVTSWFADGDPRGRYGFWDDLGGDVNGINYQGAPEWLADEWQARIVDTLHQFGERGNLHKLRAFERCAYLMFDHPTPTEDDANLDGFLGCCAFDDVKHTDAKVWGSGEGLRNLDGSPV
jgi:hypothetical protein